MSLPLIVMRWEWMDFSSVAVEGGFCGAPCTGPGCCCCVATRGGGAGGTVSSSVRARFCSGSSSGRGRSMPQLRRRWTAKGSDETHPTDSTAKSEKHIRCRSRVERTLLPRCLAISAANAVTLSTKSSAISESTCCAARLRRREESCAS